MNGDEKQYLLWAKMNSYKRKIEKAKLKIINALALTDGGNWALSYSGGKDSTALLGLLIECGWRGDLVQFRYSEFETPSENIELGQYYAEEYRLNHIIVDAFSCKDAWDSVGRFYCVPSSPEEKHLARLADSDFRLKSAALIAQNKYVGLFWGLRKRESKARTLALSVWGDTYFAKCRNCFTCNPISDFLAEDVWAYIFSRGMRYLAVYDTVGFDRREIRNELNYMCNKKAIFNGIFENYLRLYPEVIRKLEYRYGTINK